MIENLKKLGLGLILLAFTMSTSGCFALLVGAAAGAGGVIWAKGKLQQELNVSVGSMHKATIAALKKMELPIIVDKKDKLTAKVESEFSDRARIWIDIKSLTARSCKIVIRVGTLGDEQRSRQIFDMIEKNL